MGVSKTRTVKMTAPMAKKHTVIRYCPDCGYRYNINDMFLYVNNDLQHHKDRGEVLYICKLCINSYEAIPCSKFWFDMYGGFDCINASNWDEYHEYSIPPEDEQDRVRYEKYVMSLNDSISNCRY